MQYISSLNFGIYLTGYITWTSLTTSWSSASAIALILGLTMKLEKSKRKDIFSIFDKVTQYLQRATFVEKKFSHLNKTFAKYLPFPKNQKAKS